MAGMRCARPPAGERSAALREGAPSYLRPLVQLPGWGEKDVRNPDPDFKDPEELDADAVSAAGRAAKAPLWLPAAGSRRPAARLLAGCPAAVRRPFAALPLHACHRKQGSDVLVVSGSMKRAHMAAAWPMRW